MLCVTSFIVPPAAGSNDNGQDSERGEHPRLTIDEVKAMTRAADSVGESVRTGLQGLREQAVETGKAGAEVAAKAAQAAERLIVESAVDARREARKQGRRAGRKLAETTGQTRKELARASRQARREAAVRLAELRKPGRKARKAAVLAAKAAGGSKRTAKRDFKQARKDFKVAVTEAKAAAKGRRKRRRWPWLLGIVIVAGGVAYVLRPKPQPPVAAEPPRATPSPAQPQANGQSTTRTATQKKS